MQFGLNFFPCVDPKDRSAEQYFRESLHLIGLSDELGYTHIRQVEHYFKPYGGYSPNPLIFLTAAAMRTKNTRLITGAVLPAFNSPLKLAGEIGMLDAISGGRVEVGFARAFLPHEFTAFGISLDEKIAITRRLSESGADIATLNAARRGLSAVKGGGMARACTAGRLLVLVLSDVVGDDLDVIASGPCMPGDASAPDGAWTTPLGCVVRHVVVGTGDTAVAAAAHAARERLDHVPNGAHEAAAVSAGAATPATRGRTGAWSRRRVSAFSSPGARACASCG